MKTIFISLDTLRADRLGCYGYPLPTSPYMDQIASQGVLFEQAFAADIPTEVAHTGIFTGKVGLTTGVVAHGSDASFLPKSVPWLPTLLRKAGYTTAAVDNLYHLKEWFARGYRYYINTIGDTRWIDGRTINDLALPWIEQHVEEDFFLFLHYWDPHTPYLPPKQHTGAFYDQRRDPYDRKHQSMEAAYNHRAYPFFKHHHYDLLGPVTDAAYVNALYDAEIRYLDGLLEELDQHLDRLGIKDDTLLVLFGDHGESLTEHDIYWDHCGLYETTVRVPMILRWPGQIPQGRRVPGLVQQVDLMPTLLQAFNLDAPVGMDGKSLWPAIQGKTDGTHDTVFLSECAWQAARGIRTSTHKYIHTYDSGPFVRPTRELYDLRNDPGEDVNLAASQSALADQFEQELQQWVEKKLLGKTDPMKEIYQKQGLPFRRRIEAILNQVGLTWEEWLENPDKERFDRLHNQAMTRQ
ncbi:sulfatase [Aureibacillus halotolerans]|uniref:Arylsulfatase A-like enzyme n=1 Tax=Aureibacillus halotolerans TaxID=1508390 RepID=A0A4R6U3Y2_9BACI|nr:sulfatase [Aureibacillus halotolerans]TDQ40771.1 arylsulfatase A-like enzyme [Aureibacillus halotolerans]